MRWRTSAAEETRRMVSGKGATTKLTKMTKNNSQQMCGGRGGGRVRQQRWRTTTAGERWGTVVEAEERLLYGSGEETMQWRMERR
jgi:hypothetical protein